jgi:acetolactate synthase-1/2/3 large subunit
MTPPMGPVVIVADGHVQETPVPPSTQLHVPLLTLSSPPAGEQGAVNEVAKLLVSAEHPVLMADRAARTPEGLRLLVELAELVQAPVTCGASTTVMRFPMRHPLYAGQSVAPFRAADFVLALEAPDVWGSLNDYRDQLERTSKPITLPGLKVATITANELDIKSNYQDFQRYTEVDISIAADAEATLPSLVEACKKLITPARQNAIDERGKKLMAQHLQDMDNVRLQATYGWDASPVSKPRLSAELWDKIKDKDWSLVGGAVPRLWDADKFYRSIPGGGAHGVGYLAPASVGAALANRKYGRLSVSIQDDGDLMYGPGVLWTAAHHRIPMLIVMNNNRAYHQEVMHIQRMANRHQRGISNAGIGTTLTDPNIDYATLARSMGVHGEGPISNPNDLGPALLRAIATVEKGEPALVDVITQPR